MATAALYTILGKQPVMVTISKGSQIAETGYIQQRSEIAENSHKPD